jgi:hypothetical protein
MSTQSKRALAVASLTMNPVPVDDEKVADALTEELEQIVRRGVKPANVDAQIAADRVMAMIIELRSDVELYTRIKAQAEAKEFNFQILNRQQSNARALWRLAHRAKLERVQSEALVDEATQERALDVRAKLSRAVKYHFEGHTVHGAAVAAVDNSNDHLKLANDLIFLSELCSANRALLSHDPRCPESLFAEAARLGAIMRAALEARQNNSVRQMERVSALWSIIKADDKELRRVLRYLLHNTPEEMNRRFPPLEGIAKRSAQKPDTSDEGANDNRAEDNTDTSTHTAVKDAAKDTATDSTRVAAVAVHEVAASNAPTKKVTPAKATRKTRRAR